MFHQEKRNKKHVNCHQGGAGRFNKNSFLSKIQNHISEKSRRKIVLLSCKNSVKTQFLGVVEFPSIFLISKIQGSGFSFQFLKNYHNLQFFRVILNFAQECYYLKNKVGVVDFTKARGLVKFQSPRALRALGL